MSDAPSIPLDHVARLARLSLSECERERFGRQLGDILDHVAKLDAVQTEGVEALAHARPLVNRWRPDVPAASADRDTMLRNAPQLQDGHVKVPRVVGES